MKNKLYIFSIIAIMVFMFSGCSDFEKNDSNVDKNEFTEGDDKQFGISEYSEYKTNGSLYEHYICSYVSNGDGTYQREKIYTVLKGWQNW